MDEKLPAQSEEWFMHEKVSLQLQPPYLHGHRDAGDHLWCMLTGCNGRPGVKYSGGELMLWEGLFAVNYQFGDVVAFRGHDNYHSVLSLMPENREPGAKEPKRFTVNFFSTDGQYDKERAAAKQPKKKMRPNPLDKARARAARS